MCFQALADQRVGNNDGQSSERLRYPFYHTSPFLSTSSSLTSVDADKAQLSSQCFLLENSSPFNPSSSPNLVFLSKSGLQNSENPPDHDQTHSASLPAMMFKYFPPDDILFDLYNIAQFKSPYVLSHTCYISDPLTSSTEQTDLLNGKSEKIKINKDTPAPQLFILPHASKVPSWSTLSEINISASPCSPSSNLDDQKSASVNMGTLSQSSSGIPWSTQSEAALPKNSYIPLESLLQSPEINQNNSLLHGSELFLLSACTKDEETSSCLSFPLYQNNPVAPGPSDSMDSCINGCSTQSIPLCQYSFSSTGQDGLLDQMLENNVNMTEQLIPPQDRSCCHHSKSASETDYSPQMNGTLSIIEEEKLSKTVQTCQAVNNPDISASLPEVLTLVFQEVCKRTEKEPHVLCSLHDLQAKDHMEDSRKVNLSVNVSENELPRSLLFYPAKELIEIDSLDWVFQTSVDGSEDENGEVNAFFQQDDTECLACWAEPIQVSIPTATFEETGSTEALDRLAENYLLPRKPSALNSIPSTGRPMTLSLSSPTTMDADQNASSNTNSSLVPHFSSPSAILDLQSSDQSVAIQISSPLSSHIVLRKDIPYKTNSKCTLLPSVPPLDTSTPFRAVQSWTDLKIQRNALTKTLLHGVPNILTIPNKATVSTSSSEKTKSPTLTHDCFCGTTNECNVTGSVNEGLWPGDEVDRNRNEDDKVWEDNNMITMPCYCTSYHQCTCHTQENYNKQRPVGKIPVSITTTMHLDGGQLDFFKLFLNKQNKMPSSSVLEWGD